MVFLACVHLACSLHYLFLQATPLFPHGVTKVCYSFLALTVSNSSLFTPALLRTHSFFAVRETRRIFRSPFISKASRRVSSFFLSVQLSHHSRTLLQATLALSLVVSSLKSACIRQQTVVSITVRRASTHVAFSWHFLTSSMLRSTMDSRAFVVSTARRRRCGRRVRLLTTGTASCVILSSLCSSEYRPWSVAVSYSRFSDCGTLSRRHNSCSCTAQQMVGLFCTRSSAIAEGPRDASCQIKSCQLPRNIVETTYTTSPDQIDGMKLEI